MKESTFSIFLHPFALQFVLGFSTVADWDSNWWHSNNLRMFDGFRQAFVFHLFSYGTFCGIQSSVYKLIALEYTIHRVTSSRFAHLKTFLEDDFLEHIEKCLRASDYFLLPRCSAYADACQIRVFQYIYIPRRRFRFNVTICDICFRMIWRTVLLLLASLRIVVRH